MSHKLITACWASRGRSRGRACNGTGRGTVCVLPPALLSESASASQLAKHHPGSTTPSSQAKNPSASCPHPHPPPHTHTHARHRAAPLNVPPGCCRSTSKWARGATWASTPSTRSSPRWRAATASRWCRATCTAWPPSLTSSACWHSTSRVRLRASCTVLCCAVLCCAVPHPCCCALPLWRCCALPWHYCVLPLRCAGCGSPALLNALHYPAQLNAWARARVLAGLAGGTVHGLEGGVVAGRGWMGCGDGLCGSGLVRASARLTRL
jgi:hypothetical protein